MKKLWQFIKENYLMVFSTIILYQLLLTIFFFSTLNLRILGILIVIAAIKIIVTDYKDDVISFFKNLFRR